MRSNSYYKVRRVVRVIFWLSLLAGLYLIATRIWWIMYRHNIGVRAMKISTRAKCVECNRIFDLLNEEEAGEWAYGHDCEV